MVELARDGLGLAIVNDFARHHAGWWLERTGFSAAGTESLRRLVVDTVFG